MWTDTGIALVEARRQRDALTVALAKADAAAGKLRADMLALAEELKNRAIANENTILTGANAYRIAADRLLDLAEGTE